MMKPVLEANILKIKPKYFWHITRTVDSLEKALGEKMEYGEDKNQEDDVKDSTANWRLEKQRCRRKEGTSPFVSPGDATHCKRERNTERKR